MTTESKLWYKTPGWGRPDEPALQRHAVCFFSQSSRLKSLYGFSRRRREGRNNIATQTVPAFVLQKTRKRKESQTSENVSLLFGALLSHARKHVARRCHVEIKKTKNKKNEQNQKGIAYLHWQVNGASTGISHSPRTRRLSFLSDSFINTDSGTSQKLWKRRK